MRGGEGVGGEEEWAGQGRVARYRTVRYSLAWCDHCMSLGIYYLS